MTSSVLKEVVRGAAATKLLGRKLGRYLKAGDVTLLVAPLGAGKTTFVQGIAEGVDGNDEPLSPTFTLAQTIQGRIALHHLDFYRLTKKEIVELGVQDFLTGGGAVERGAVVIEWADLCKELWPKDRLEVRIKHAEKGRARQFVFRAVGPRAKSLLAKLKS